MTEMITLLKLCAVVVIFLVLLAAAMILISFVTAMIITGRRMLKEQLGDKKTTGKAGEKDPKESKENEEDA